MKAKSNSPKETQKIAQNLAHTLKGGEVIALFGDLGAGKTVFAQGLAKGLNLKRRVVSPTFVFMRTYPITVKGKKLTFYHIDLYRGENSQDFENLGLGEVFDMKSIVVLEWADKIKDILPEKRIDVTLEKLNEEKRRIEIKRRG